MFGIIKNIALINKTLCAFTFAGFMYLGLLITAMTINEDGLDFFVARYLFLVAGVILVVYVACYFIRKLGSQKENADWQNNHNKNKKSNDGAFDKNFNVPQDRLFKAEKNINRSSLISWIVFALGVGLVFVGVMVSILKEGASYAPIISMLVVVVLFVVGIVVVHKIIATKTIPATILISDKKLVFDSKEYTKEDIQSVVMTEIERQKQSLAGMDSARKICIKTNKGTDCYMLGRVSNKELNSYWGKYGEMAVAVYDWCQANGVKVEFSFLVD